MQYLTALDDIASGRVNSLVYSKPGRGKTTYVLQHPYPVLVDAGERGYQTVLEYGHDVPVLMIDDMEDAMDIAYDTDAVMDIYFKHHPEFVGYPYASFGFENLNMFQETMLGRESKIDDKKKVIRPAEGIMALPNSRDNRYTPGMKDFNVLSRKTKELIKGIRNMPYHTVMTVHAGIFDNEESPKGLNVPDDARKKEGFPNLYGQLKWIGGGLADLFVYLERTPGPKYSAYNETYKKFEGRTKLSKYIPGKIDWTDKNLYDIYQGYINTAIQACKRRSV